MARFALIALVAAPLFAILALGAPPAFADGKVFLSVAVDGAGAGSTMPRQRAIIAFRGGEQRLAIDTAFTGAGEEFAWLVPLPSEPEISPATKGMFDTAALLTAPRVISRVVPMEVIAPGVLIVGGVLTMIWWRVRRTGAAIFLFTVLGCFFFLLPALGGSGRGGPSISQPQIHQQKSVGAYDTVVLTALHATDVIGWLVAEGYKVPDGAKPVVQDYLNRGWVFAAAKLRDEVETKGERRAHPLQFRFAAEQPVYPMALTAIENEQIELELYVFANGTAKADRLRSVTALEVKPDDRPTRGDKRSSINPRHSMTLAHPGLVSLASDLPWITRLSATLSPEDQREDISISVDEPRSIHAEFRTPESGKSLVLSVTVWTAVIPCVVWLIVAGATRRSDGAPFLGKSSPRWPWLLLILGTGVVGGAAIHRSIFVYAGETQRWLGLHTTEAYLKDIAEFIANQPPGSFGASQAEIEEHLQATLVDFDFPTFTGDSPLHYRIEFNDDETEAQFIWHDLIGAEHRVVIPVEPGEPAGAAGP